jgi:hypothetical protein
VIRDLVLISAIIAAIIRLAGASLIGELMKQSASGERCTEVRHK